MAVKSIDTIFNIDSDADKDKGTLLKISDILTKDYDELTSSIDKMKKILYARPIEKKENKTHIEKAMDTVTHSQSWISSMYESIFNTLKKTESEAYDTGETANHEKEKLESIMESIQTLKDSYNEFYDMDVNNTIEKYNEKLAVLKNGAKKKLLQMAAEEINKAAINGTSKYIVDETTITYHKNHIPKDGEIAFADEYCRYSNPVDTPDGNVQYTETHYVYFKYWGWFKGDFWTWFDWDEKKIINKFNKYGVPIPYDSASIVEMDMYQYVEPETNILSTMDIN